jgi:hypothetical protein
VKSARSEVGAEPDTIGSWIDAEGASCAERRTSNDEPERRTTNAEPRTTLRCAPCPREIIELGFRLRCAHANDDGIVLHGCVQNVRERHVRRMPAFATHGADVGVAFRKDSTMNRRSLTDRVEILENTVDDLRKWVGQVDAITARLDGFDVQFVQLRGEMRAECSGVREEIRQGDEETRRSLGEEMSTSFGKLKEQIEQGDEETRRSIREEIRQGDEETRRFMRVLHEDLVARIAMLGERPH